MTSAAAPQAWKKAANTEVQSGKDEVKSGPKILKLASGSDGKFVGTLVRILPPRADAPKDRWYTWAQAHFNVGPTKRQVRCLEDFELPCPVCAYAGQLKRDGFEDEADKIRQQTYGLVNVVKLNKETGLPDGGVQVWRSSTKWVVQLINQLEDEDDGVNGDDISDPEVGRNVTIRRTGSGRSDSEYKFTFKAKSEFNGGDFSLLNTMYDLENIFTVYESEKLQALAHGQAKQLTTGRDPFDDDEEGDGPPAEAVEGSYRALEETASAKENEPAPAEVKTPAKEKVKAGSEADRDELKALLQKKDDDEDGDGDGDDDED